MYVVKRDGKHESVQFDKITARLRALCKLPKPLSDKVDPVVITQKVVQGLTPGMRTTQLDTLAAETAASLVTVHPHYGRLAARIEISNWQKETPKTFLEAMTAMYMNVAPVTQDPAPLISEKLYQLALKFQDKIEAAINYSRDFNYDFFGFRTLQKSYLCTINGKPIERPQHMLMRVALGVNNDDWEAVLDSYHWMSQLYFTHATPTLFNAGTNRPQMSSCFLVGMKDDSIEGIYETLKEMAIISASAGGQSVHVHKVRSSGSYIKGSHGTANGLVPMLRVFNDTARYVDQGGGRRKGAFAVYLEPWHADIFDFLELRKPHGKEEQRARDLFYSVWIPDLFMKRVEANEDWTLFCPNEAPGLADVWGDQFEELYHKYEQDTTVARRKVRAQELWFAILEAQIENGTPYMMFKDACNRKSNQQNLGTIQSSNLCTEIVQYTSAEEIAVCNLASIALPKFLSPKPATGVTTMHSTVTPVATGLRGGDVKVFDHGLLYEVVQRIVKNMNNVVDGNYYPVPETKVSNTRHRPLGIGVQGLADVFFKLKIPYTSADARRLNAEIFETIYYAALSASCGLARKFGPYSSFAGSPASKGILQFDMWGVTPDSGRWDWTELKQDIVKYGLRNSLLIAPMPTASTSQIMGNTESFEPLTSNIFTRRVLAGEFVVINRFLVRDLTRLGLWSSEMKDRIVSARGSVANIDDIPRGIREVYKVVWDMKMKDLIDMAADRGAYIDQSQSFNCFMAQPTIAKLTSMHFHGWKKGLKTGMYYLRTLPSVDPIAITINRGRIGPTSPVVNQPYAPSPSLNNPVVLTIPPLPVESVTEIFNRVNAPGHGNPFGAFGAAAPVPVLSESNDSNLSHTSDLSDSSTDSGLVEVCLRGDGGPDCLVCGS